MGTVKAHVDNSLMNKGATPCVFIFEDPNQQLKPPVLEPIMSSERDQMMRGVKDVFLPQLDDNLLDPGKHNLSF